jgi:transcriptional regulator with XRE-family HTH domain
MAPKPSSPNGSPEWSQDLRRYRERSRLSRYALAARAGVSEEAIKAFERGRRRPKESTLNAIADALGLTREEANPIRLALAYPPDWYAILHERWRSDGLDLQAQIELLPWPAFVTNQAIDIVAHNAWFPRIFRSDDTRELLGEGERNLMAQVGNPRFMNLFANIEEVVAFMIGTVKGDPRWSESLSNPSPWLNDAVSRLLAGNPALVTLVGRLWGSTPPIPHRARHLYPVRLHHPGGSIMHFQGSASIADLWNELTWHEWVPENAKTWALLNELS